MDPQSSLPPEPDPRLSPGDSSTPWPGREASSAGSDPLGESNSQIFESLYSNSYDAPPPPRSGRRVWALVALGVVSFVGILLLISVLSALGVASRSPNPPAIATSTGAANLSTAADGNGTLTPTVEDPTVTVGPGTPTPTPIPFIPGGSGMPTNPPAPTVTVGPGTPTPTPIPTATSVPPTATPLPTYTTVDDAVQGSGVNEFNYAGHWLHSTGLPDVYDGTLSRSLLTGATASIAFTGTEIQLYATRGPDLGFAGYRLDGGPEVEVDQYASIHLVNRFLYDSGKLARGNHTLEILFTGLKNANSSDYQVTIDDVVITS